MGHRHDEPPEVWVDPESLDPTPVWKQYLLILALLALSLVLIGVVSVAALMPRIVTPPAVVPGGRVVLALEDLPTVGGQPRLIGAPLLPVGDAFWLAQPVAGEAVAVRARWSSPDAAAECAVVPLPPFIRRPSGIAPGIAPMSLASFRLWSFSASCPPEAGLAGSPVWGPRGEPIAAPRGLDRYLVSVDRDRLIVNISREIRGYGATPQPPVPPLTTR